MSHFWGKSHGKVLLAFLGGQCFVALGRMDVPDNSGIIFIIALMVWVVAAVVLFHST